MSYRCVFAAGGTGGHLFPAQQVAEKLQARGVEVIFVAHGLHTSSFFSRHSFAYHDISSASISKNPVTLCRSVTKIAQGVTRSISVIKALRPDLVVGFGSYHTVPPLIASYMLSIPYVLYEANAYPGRVIRLFSKKALWNGVFFESAQSALSGTSKLVAMPLRKEFYEDFFSKSEVLRSYGLCEGKKTIVVFGGSQGAKKINNLMIEVAHFLHKDQYQVIHFTGDSDFSRVHAAYKKMSLDHYVAPFESKMRKAYLAADLVVSRSGASTVAELLHCHVPSILIPFPSAANNHQLFNAQYLAQHVKAASVVLESDLTPHKLYEEITNACQDIRLKNMTKNMRLYTMTSNRQEFSDMLLEAL